MVGSSLSLLLLPVLRHGIRSQCERRPLYPAQFRPHNDHHWMPEECVRDLPGHVHWRRLRL